MKSVAHEASVICLTQGCVSEKERPLTHYVTLKELMQNGHCKHCVELLAYALIVFSGSNNAIHVMCATGTTFISLRRLLSGMLARECFTMSGESWIIG